MAATTSNIVINNLPSLSSNDCPINFSEKCLEKNMVNLKYKGNTI